MKPFDGIEPPAELLARAERERRDNPGLLIRPVFRELAERGAVTAEEWNLPKNSYEQHLLVSRLRLEPLLEHTEYCLTQCSRYRGPIPTSYDEAVIHELAPELIRRIRSLLEKEGKL